jgi:anti-sigma regulatory factor (Ser/Thr protein kinase)
MNGSAGHRDQLHVAAFYHDDQTFLDLVGPFLAEGLAAGEPVLAAFTPHRRALLEERFTGIRFLDAGVHYARPASAIHRYRQLLQEYVAAGANRIRIAGEVPHPGTGVPWEWWGRYEATANCAFADFPLWALCPYDTRTVPSDVLDEVCATHPYLAGRAGLQPNPDFVEPETFLAGRTVSWRDPLEDGPPLTQFTIPQPAEVREAVLTASGSTALPENDVHGLALGVTEAVTNAMQHGTAPVTVRLWRAARRIVVTVTDAGTGPGDPFAGLLPGAVSRTSGGLGLWLAHQMCNYVTLSRDREGFTVRLVAGHVEP